MSLASPHASDARAALCRACGRAQMVPGRVPGDVRFECAYCGEEQSCGLGGAREAGYRRSAARVRGKGGRLVGYDLREVPRGLPARASDTDLRARFDAARERPLDVHAQDPELEWQLTWISARLSSRRHFARDLVGERALLEAALERLTLPAYRALILARLSRLASSARAFDLAEAWLSLAETAGIAEVDGDVEAARAYLEMQRGDAAAALARLGAEDTSAIGGSARSVADLLRIEALERLGRSGDAYRLHRTAIRAHGNEVIASVGAQYRLAEKSRRRAVEIGVVVLLVLVAIAAAFTLALR